MIFTNPAIANREPRFVPLTDADRQTVRCIEYLSTHGYPDAARSLQTQIKKYQIVTLIEVSQNKALLDVLLEASDNGDAQCRIFSSCYSPFGYWRVDAKGYTSDTLEAWVVPFRKAYEASGHACFNGKDSKGIMYEIIDNDEGTEIEPRQSGWKS